MDEREKLLSKLERYLTIRNRISNGMAVTIIEELIKETEVRLAQIENNALDQKALEPTSGEVRDDDLPDHSPRPRGANRRRLL